MASPTNPIAPVSPTPPVTTKPVKPEVDTLKEAETKLEASNKKLETKREELEKATADAGRIHMEYSNLLREVATCEAAVAQAKFSKPTVEA